MSTIEKAMAKLAGKQPEDDKKHQVTAETSAEQPATASEPKELAENVAVTAPDPATTDKETTASAETVSAEPRQESADTALAESSTTKAVAASAELISEPEEASRPETLIVHDKQPVGSDTAQEDSSNKYAELDVTYLNRKGYISKQSDNKLVKEQFRAVKRKLLNNAFGPLSSTLNNPNLIIVSSCNPHEGKTFSSINLALNIALERDKTVLLVDADVVRPSIVRELGVTVDAGLTEYLSGQVNDVSEIIYNTNIDNFKFIPAGKPHDLSTELLASEKMIALTQELATRYGDRVVIFDAPPLLGVNETHVMANHVGQAVVVVEESKTRLNDIKAAVAQLDEKLAIGFLVNKSKRGWRDYYGYGYYRRD